MWLQILNSTLSWNPQSNDNTEKIKLGFLKVNLLSYHAFLNGAFYVWIYYGKNYNSGIVIGLVELTRFLKNIKKKNFF